MSCSYSPSIPEESTASKHTSTASDIKLTTPHRPAKSSESSSQYRPAKPPESTGRSLKRKRTSCQSVQDGLVQDGLLRTVDLYYTNQVHEFEELEEQPVTNSELLRSIEGRYFGLSICLRCGACIMATLLVLQCHRIVLSHIRLYNRPTEPKTSTMMSFRKGIKGMKMRRGGGRGNIIRM